MVPRMMASTCKCDHTMPPIIHGNPPSCLSHETFHNPKIKTNVCDNILQVLEWSGLTELSKLEHFPLFLNPVPTPVFHLYALYFCLGSLLSLICSSNSGFCIIPTHHQVLVQTLIPPGKHCLMFSHLEPHL